MKNRKINIYKLIFIVAVIILVNGGLVFAWFFMSDASINELEGEVTDLDDIIVKMKVIDDEKNVTKYDMNKINADGKIIDEGLAKLINITEDNIAPGAFGEIYFSITSNSVNFNEATIKITPNPNVIDNLSSIVKLENGESVPVITEEELTDIIQSHILFFTNREYDEESGKYVYSGNLSYDIDNDEPVKTTTSLTQNEEKEVTIYWVWPYEYSDYNEYLELGIPATSSLTRAYDEADTKIGNYVKSINLHFKVEANTSTS